MGFASGLPLLLTLSTLSYWLAKVGVDKTSIGLFPLVGLPYSLKFLWAPVIDQVHIPVLARLLGHRRRWALVIQAALIAAILPLGPCDPAAAPCTPAAAALAVAFLSPPSFWLAKVGVYKTSIGLFALVGLPYSLKFLWAPVIDQVHSPVLARLLGHRRSWALVIQAALIAASLALGTCDPAAAPWTTAAAALAVAFFSASQDIVIDAYRIEILTDEEQGVGAASTQFGYLLGILAAGAGDRAPSGFVGWFWGFFALFVIVLVWTFVGFLLVEPP